MNHNKLKVPVKYSLTLYVNTYDEMELCKIEIYDKIMKKLKNCILFFLSPFLLN